MSDVEHLSMCLFATKIILVGTESHLLRVVGPEVPIFFVGCHPVTLSSLEPLIPYCLAPSIFHHSLYNLSYFPWIALVDKNHSSNVCRLFKLSTLFHWSICWSFCQYHSVWVIVVYVLKSDSGSPATLFFFFSIFHYSRLYAFLYAF